MKRNDGELVWLNNEQFVSVMLHQQGDEPLGRTIARLADRAPEPLERRIRRLERAVLGKKKRAHAKSTPTGRRDMSESERKND